MDGRELLAQRASKIFDCLMEDDREVVGAWMTQERNDAFTSGKRTVEIGGYLGGSLIIGVILFVTILAGFTIQDSRKTMEVQKDCEQIRTTCIERVLCTCKDLPVEAP